MTEKAVIQNPVLKMIRSIQKQMRSMYDWVTGWSKSPYGAWALFILAFAESSFFPVPPDVLLIALCVGAPKKAFKYALICTAGSLIGGILGYYIGFGAFETVGEPILKMYDPDHHYFDKIQQLYGTYGFWGVLTAAITPLPYKIFTIASGVFKFNFGQFMLASVIGRSFRFFLVGTLLFFGGKSLQKGIDKYFDLLAWVFLLLLIAGFFAIKFI